MEIHRKKLLSLVIALDDMIEAESVCEILINNRLTEKDSLYSPLLTALIVS